MASALETERSQAWCLFKSQSQAWAVQLQRVCEVVNVDRLARLPFSPPELLGLCSIRREVIPVVHLDHGSAPEPGSSYRPSAVVVLRTEQGPWGIGINRDGITVFDETNADDTSDTSHVLPQAKRHAVQRGDESYAVIDPENVWTTVRSAIERWYRTARPREAQKGLDYGQ